MGFFSRFFGKSNTKQLEEERNSHDSQFDLIIIYKGYKDSDEQADKYTDLEDELWVYDCIGTSGAMSSETAKQYGIPMPAYPEYPLIGVFELVVKNGQTEGYSKPLFISSKKEEVKRFCKEFERTHK
ncbi:hypothetical protein R4Z09_29255 [Niallia oryzisoli]|uniref:Uncharacterized protein n=1 Tax=Niallia oryzisoli TaxID=1737571 RepID=A0ABZ2CFZ3_9BACI